MADAQQPNLGRPFCILNGHSVHVEEAKAQGNRVKEQTPNPVGRSIPNLRVSDSHYANLRSILQPERRIGGAASHQAPMFAALEDSHGTFTRLP